MCACVYIIRHASGLLFEMRPLRNIYTSRHTLIVYACLYRCATLALPSASSSLFLSPVVVAAAASFRFLFFILYIFVRLPHATRNDFFAVCSSFNSMRFMGKCVLCAVLLCCVVLCVLHYIFSEDNFDAFTFRKSATHIHSVHYFVSAFHSMCNRRVCVFVRVFFFLKPYHNDFLWIGVA